ncbi:MAG: LysR family transcriptional regulator [Pigmentiphaga sp.]|nr:LysR family transcriptional regulator [Pigmentiphaga sp.]
MLDLRRIRQFVVLAEVLNFRRAAERLHMAQPPLSVSIQKLESDLGVRLFERGGAGGVTLTPSGLAALPEARRLLFHNAQLGEVARAAKAGLGGALSVGFVGSSTHGSLQRMVRLFRSEYPGVELVLKEATSVTIMDRVAERQLDIGVVRTPLMTAPRVELSSLLAEPFVAALPAGSHLARLPELRLEDLSQESFVFYSREEAAGLHAMAILACQLSGFLPSIAQEATQVQTVLALVESGLGVALVPSIMQTAPNAGVVFRRIVDMPEAATIGLAIATPAEQPSPAASRFRELAQRALHSGGQPLDGSPLRSSPASGRADRHL